jgi:serine/threonine protein kinase
MPDRLGQYRLLKRIGEGGMGVVFLARSPGQQSVALKVLRSSVATEPTARHRLAREVETMQRVRSPYVAEVIDADLEGDMPYIVTRYVPGRTLDEVVSETGPLTGPGLARLAAGLAEALVAVHAAGVVHRDLKPSNVMLLDGTPVVIDFGIAQGPDATRLTMTGMFMGTPGYLAPEVIEGRPSSQSSDVHAWGATVAFAAIGHPPYGTGSYEGIFYRIVNGQPDLGRVPPVLLPLLSAALARDPAHRPPAVQLAAQAGALDPAALTAASVPQPPPGQAGSPWATRADAAQAGLVPGVGMGALNGQDVAGLGAAGLAGVPPGSNGASFGPSAFPGQFNPGTHPLNSAPSLSDDLADVLPPVQYQPRGQPAGNQPPGSGTPGTGPGQPASGRLAAGLGGADQPASQTRTHRLLVVAAMVVVASVSVILPVIGTLVALSLIVVLRAAGLAQRRGTQRRLARGSRPTDPFVATVAFPWFLLRALVAMLLLSPFALAVGAVATGIAVALDPGDWPPRALAYGAGAVVAFYALGPGSRTARNQLRRVFGMVATTRTAQAIALTGMTAMAVAALSAALSWPSLYWPALTPGGSLHFGIIHLAPLHRVSLLHHFGVGHRITLLQRLVMHRLGLLRHLAAWHS